MIIQHNLTAINAGKQLNIVDKMQAAHMEKLSSGFRINRAADDAAGLAISEKMRSQIRGLNQGIRNTQDGISLLQVADGALSEVHSIIQRINELSVQSANGTNSHSDRAAIQSEVGQLLTEIDRISDTTTFNEKLLFGGSSVEKTPPPSSPANPAPVTPADVWTACGAFMVSGTGYSFNNNILTIADGADVKIKGTGNPTWHRIEVENGASANITLKDVKIEVGGWDTAFNIAEGSAGHVAITLEGENVLKSGGWHSAGLQKNGTNGSLTISGTGSLTAIGGQYAAGIGGGNQKASSGITISGGTVTAIGGQDGAGIGGGGQKDGTNITISGGTVTAIGGVVGAGIGGGSNGAGNNITISGGTVTAAGGSSGAAGIGGGGGNGNSGSNITISGGTVTATGKDGGAGIGGGRNRVGNGITISGGTVTAAGSANAQSIGSGSGAGGTGATVSGSGYQPAGRGTTSTIAAGPNGALIIDDKTGTVKGNATLDEDFTIPQGVTVSVGTNAALTVADGATLTNSGIINNDGAIDVYGKFTNSGTLNGNPVTEHPKIVNTPDTQAADGIWIQCGADAGSGMFVKIDAMNTKLLDLDGIDVSTEQGAGSAISAAGGALAHVSDLRSKIGAQQNRLEHTIANEGNIAENTAAAESRIRDADMADEMVAFSVANILARAGVTMLAQANTNSQGVLVLLG